jgi:hypothetical protein
MKNFLLFVGGVAQLRNVLGQKLDTTCDTNPCNLFDANAACNPYREVSTKEHTCVGSNIELGYGVTLNECTDAVAGDSTCSNIMLFTPATTDSDSICACHVSDTPISTCVVGSSFPLMTTVYELAPDAPFCSCSMTDGNVYTGKTCSLSNSTEVEFVEKLNLLNNAVNVGELALEASAVSVSSQNSDIFNDIELFQAASLLNRGYDGEVTLDVTLYGINPVPIEEWQGYISESVTLIFTRAGYQVDASQFQPLNVPDFIATSCHCRDVDVSNYECSTEPDACSLYSGAVFIVRENPELAAWELALIILACCIVICLVSVGLSSIKTDIDAEILPVKVVEK